MTASQKGTRATIGSAFFATLVALMVSLYLKVEIDMLVANMIITLFAFFSLVSGMMYTQGWKVFNHKTVVGIPTILFVFYIVLGLIVGMLFVAGSLLSDDFSPSSQLNVFSVATAMGSGVFGSMIAWYTGINKWMALGSEYDARMQFKSKGYSPEIIEEKINALKEKQLISSTDADQDDQEFESESDFTFNHGYFPKKGIVGGRR